MKVADFDFDLPRALIAARPMEPRDAARRLVIGAGLLDCGISDLPGLLRPGDILVVNDTLVIPARLFGKRGAAKVEITLHKPKGGGRWHAFAKGARKLKRGDVITFGAGAGAECARTMAIPSDTKRANSGFWTCTNVTSFAEHPVLT